MEEQLYKSLLKLDRKYQEEISRSKAALMQIRIEANALVKNSGVQMELNNNYPIEHMLHDLREKLTRKYLKGLENE